MIAVVQRVSRAEVRVAGREPAAIKRGLLILVGVARDDTESDARWLAHKCLALRVFNDDAGKMNLGLEDVSGSVLAISQFTLLGDCVKGRRPSWSRAAEPSSAERLYNVFVEHLSRSPARIATGVFQAKMEVESLNDGPVTLIIDSREWRSRPAQAVEAVRDESDQTRVGAGGTGERLLRTETGPVYLASRSPRRAQLLEMLGLEFRIHPPAEDGGHWRPSEDPAAYAREQAVRKTLTVAREVRAGVVIGADTVVFIDGTVLEKPRDRAEAAAHLRRLSGREHEVFTGVCIARAGGRTRVCGSERSRVRMAELDDATIATYVASGEPLDKAGAYGIQGLGGMLVESIAGCYFNVMGLPLARMRSLFRELEGISP